MTPHRLLTLYDRVADAPEAVPRLRRFVLDLAVRGRLVMQDAADEPAAELLKRIDRLVEHRPTRRGKQRDTSATNALENLPFDVPSGWSFAALDRIVRVLNGRAYKQQELLSSGTPVLRVGNLFTSNHWYFSDLDLDEDKYCESGDLIYAWSASFGPFIWSGPRAIFHYHIWKLPLLSEADLCKGYLLLFLQQKTREIKEAGHGMSMVHMTKEKMERLVVPLPPIAEQRRIVAKVEKLMGLLDRLEAERRAREGARDRLTTTTLARLTTPEAEPASAATHTSFALKTLPTLTTRPDQLKHLRQSILNLAVGGKLVEHDPSDEPASDLLKRIAKERMALLDAGYPNPSEAKTQKKKQGQQQLPSDLPQLPLGWSWATLQQCSLMVIDCKNKTAPYSEIGIRLVRTTNVREGALNSIDQKFVSEAIYEAWSLRAKPEQNDILITREAPMGEVCIIPKGERVCLGQRMMLARLVPETIDTRFMLYSLRDPDLMERVQDKPLGMTVQHLRVGGVETLLIPLPPLAEQHRIVAKVDALMALCDSLEASLTAANTTRQRLLESLLHEALDTPESLEAAA